MAMAKVRMPQVIERTVFTTSDGKSFGLESEAEEHQMRITFVDWCNTHICRGGPWSGDDVAKEILEYWTVRAR